MTGRINPEELLGVQKSRNDYSNMIGLSNHDQGRAHRSFGGFLGGLKDAMHTVVGGIAGHIGGPIGDGIGMGYDMMGDALKGMKDHKAAQAEAAKGPELGPNGQPTIYMLDGEGYDRPVSRPASWRPEEADLKRGGPVKRKR